ncbi:MAG TPA: serine hydrolase, partial [Gaiellaceae bacterium]|nr:serine hydrolase [Gaiellaceae bacterium]
VVRPVYGLPAAARPRLVRARHDLRLARELRRLGARFDGTAGLYVQSLTSGAGAAWNAGAEFPGASTLKVAIAAAVLAEHRGLPPPGSRLDRLLQEMIVPSDDEAANELLVWLGGSTSAGGRRVTGLMRDLGMRDSEMYGGYLTRSVSGPIPVRVERQPAFVGKRTSARDLALLLRALWLRSAGLGPFGRVRPGLTAAEARYLLWLLASVRDTPKLDRFLAGRPGVAVLHKAGWISTARHDAGLVFWRGGVFVAAAMTWRPAGAKAADVLAGRLALRALARFRELAGMRG